MKIVSKLWRLLFVGLIVVAQERVLAWGPHSEITQAAVDRLGKGSALEERLGGEMVRLKDYCWMADMRRSLHRDAKEWYYPDDFLLFPKMTRHRDHLCPEVKETYEPFFRRALQALRTESGENAARWIGSIMHFTEDTGSPPHAAEIRGPVHSKMENWVDAKAISIADYKPQLLGATDDEAVAGFKRRMDGLIEFSKERAARAKPFVLGEDRASTEPIVLESALECSRVVADLLFTLGELSKQTPADGTSLGGVVRSSPAPGLEKLQAKVVLLGTDFSTLADADGRYQFRNLPPENYSVAAVRPGSEIETVKVTLLSRESVRQDVAMRPDFAPGNMVRNGSFGLHWLGVGLADDWYQVKWRGEETHWEGEMLPLKTGASYRLHVEWQEHGVGQVNVRLSGGVNMPGTDLQPLNPGDTDFVFSAGAGVAFAQVLIFGKGTVEGIVKGVAVVEMSKPE